MTFARSDWRLALSRFGYGARPGDGARAGDPAEALCAELAAPGAARIDGVELRSTAQILQDVYAFERRRKMEREGAALASLSKSAMPAPEVAALLFPAPSSGTAGGATAGAPAPEIPPARGSTSRGRKRET